MGCGSSMARSQVSKTTRVKQNKIMSPELREEIHDGLGVALVACSLKGFRRTQEDTSSIMINLGGQDDLLGFGVFDGHSGPQASQYVSANIWDQVTSTQAWAEGDVDGALRAGFLALDASMRHEQICHGTTAVVAVITPGYLYVANCGDSRAVLCKAGTANAMSMDHKPSLYTERARVLRCGGQVLAGEFGGVCRVTMPGAMVAMATSRSLGDFHFKRSYDQEPGEQVVSPSADVTCMRRSHDDQFLILGTDGVWDVLTNQEVCDIMVSADRVPRPPARAVSREEGSGRRLGSVATRGDSPGIPGGVSVVHVMGISSPTSTPWDMVSAAASTPAPSEKSTMFTGASEKALAVLKSMESLDFTSPGMGDGAMPRLIDPKDAVPLISSPSVFESKHVKRLTTSSLSPPSSWVCSDLSDRMPRMTLPSTLSPFSSSGPPSTSDAFSLPFADAAGSGIPGTQALSPSFSVVGDLERKNGDRFRPGGDASSAYAYPVSPTRVSPTGVSPASVPPLVTTTVARSPLGNGEFGGDRTASMIVEGVESRCNTPAGSPGASLASVRERFFERSASPGTAYTGTWGIDPDALVPLSAQALPWNGDVGQRCLRARLPEVDDEKTGSTGINGALADTGTMWYADGVSELNVNSEGSTVRVEQQTSGRDREAVASTSNVSGYSDLEKELQGVEDSCVGGNKGGGDTGDLVGNSREEGSGDPRSLLSPGQSSIGPGGGVLGRVSTDFSSGQPLLPQRDHAASDGLSKQPGHKSSSRRGSGTRDVLGFATGFLRRDRSDGAGSAAGIRRSKSAPGASSDKGREEGSRQPPSHAKEAPRVSDDTSDTFSETPSSPAEVPRFGAMAAARSVLDRALLKGSQDNMTLIAVDLRGFLGETPEPSPPSQPVRCHK